MTSPVSNVRPTGSAPRPTASRERAVVTPALKIRARAGDDFAVGSAAAFQADVIRLVGLAISAEHERRAATARGDKPAAAAAAAELAARAAELGARRQSADLTTRARWRLNSGFDHGAFWSAQDRALQAANPQVFPMGASSPPPDPDAVRASHQDRAKALIALLDAGARVQGDLDTIWVKENGTLEAREFGSPLFAAIDAAGTADGRITEAELAAALAELPPKTIRQLDRALSKVNGRAFDGESVALGVVVAVITAAIGVGYGSRFLLAALPRVKEIVQCAAFTAGFVSWIVPFVVVEPLRGVYERRQRESVVRSLTANG